MSRCPTFASALGPTLSLVIVQALWPSLNQVI
jgi:hypothetical protein